jgi:toxin ParE1/3/4
MTISSILQVFHSLLCPQDMAVIYRISDATVFVLSVIDSRRNVEDILLNRFVK